MLNKRRPLAADTVFTLAMICVFAVTSLLLVLFGAKVYKNIVAQMDNNFQTRTGLAYVTNKIRNADTEGKIYLECQNDGSDILVISENHGGTETHTVIYFYEGWLREVLKEADEPFDARYGESIVAAADFTMQDRGDGCLLFTLTTVDGSVLRMTVSLRS
ncbi:MAG: DUF4860 domain-containing protein [Clostridiales bacterium]|nr:DUF4860 domain-containing protein [Clostridiales bacterium]